MGVEFKPTERKVLAFEEFEKNESKLIRFLIGKFPDRYLFTDVFFINSKELSDLVTTAYFKCAKCNIPINHRQMAFSTLCGACDMGKERPEWKIEVPYEVKEWADKIHLEIENKELKEREIELKKQLADKNAP